MKLQFIMEIKRDKKEYNGVVWKTHRDFLFEHESFNQDVFIVLREKHPFYYLKYIDAKRKFCGLKMI
jgi:hypothetical protein